MVTAVYILCAVTSSLCFVLLARAYLQTRRGFQFWSALGFLGLALNNIVLVYDAIVVPHIDLAILRNIPTVLGLGCILYGFTQESE